ncbi:sensor domain-containing protein [Arsenicicoccus dermatophilus]|uniref:sensor histidine kinase n=1 Tax=Arsenicicoccus dermatophilus TaxID=1076331 RepID=UPI0039175052
MTGEPVPLPAPDRHPRRPELTQAVRDSGYVLLGWPLLLAGFVPVVVLLAVGVGTSIIGVGLPVLVAGLALAHGLAGLERSLQSALLGRQVPAPLPLEAPGGSAGRRALAALRDPQRLADVTLALGGWTAATVTWCLAVVWWATMLVTLTAGVWQPRMWYDRQSYDLADLLGVGDSLVGHVIVHTLLGLLLLAGLPRAMRTLAQVQSRWTGWLLVAPTRIARAEAVHRRQRERAQAAEAGALTRLERDIHDGPQQRLVRLQLDLARAARQ